MNITDANPSYDFLLFRQQELLAHPEHDYRVTQELREVDELLAGFEQEAEATYLSERAAEVAATQYFLSRGL